jgi:ATP-dependent RNA helicase DeaD
LTQSFSTFDLRPELAQTVADLGYTTPTPIQSALIPVMLTGRDVIGQAQTGTGKTAAFALPTLHRLAPGVSAVQALVLVPTRELAIQVATALHGYGRGLGARVLPVYGGQPYQRQIDRLRKGIDVVVGTPGRLLDLIEQGALDLGHVSTVVLDEADEMLSMGFSEDLEKILDRTPAERQTALLSATMPAGIRRLAERYLRDPETCTVARQEQTDAAIEQRYYAVRHGDKVNALARLLEVEPVVSALVFAQTRAGVAEVADALAERGFSTEALSGELAQSARTEVLDRFRRQRVQILVATDVAARGLDIDHVSHVFNVDLPRDPEVYVHRIGRTGRAGKSGVAISLVAPYHRNELRKIEGYQRQAIAPAVLPTPEEIERHRDGKLQEQLAAQIAEEPNARDRALVAALVAAGLDPMDVAVAALGLARTDEQQRPIAPIEEIGSRAPRRPALPERRGDRPDQFHNGAPVRMVPITLDTGRADGILPGQIVGALAYWADIPGHVIGKIRIEEDHTRVDVPEGVVEQVLAKRGSYMIGRQKVAVERA